MSARGRVALALAAVFLATAPAGAATVYTIEPPDCCDPTTTTLPACPPVTYNGELNNPGPRWANDTAPDYDCNGPTPPPEHTPPPLVLETPAAAVTANPNATG